MAGVFQRLFNKVFATLGGPSIGPRQRDIDVLRQTHTHGDAIKRILSGESPRAEIQVTSRKTASDEAEAALVQGRASVFGNIEEQFRRALAEMDEAEKRRESARSQEPWERFVREGVAVVRGVDFQSSNVYRIHYDVRFGSLFVEFNKLGKPNYWLYRYWPINEREAASVFHSTSKGIWVWDNLRIRGTKLGHRKNYQIVGSTGAYPQWTTSMDRAYAHDVQAAQQSGAKGPYQALGKFALTTPQINAGTKAQSRQEEQ